MVIEITTKTSKIFVNIAQDYNVITCLALACKNIQGMRCKQIYLEIKLMIEYISTSSKKYFPLLNNQYKLPITLCC